MIRFKCEALLFDLDGVLVDSGYAVRRTWQDWASQNDLDPARVLETAHGRRTEETVRRFAPHLDVAAETRKLERAEIEDTDGIAEIAGAADLISALPPDGWAVVTSGTRALATSRLRHSGLPVPKVFVCAEDVKRGKPDPECYLKGADLLGVAPERCVVIEDAPAGIEAARSADMPVIALATTHAAAELAGANAVVSTLRDIQPGKSAPIEGRKAVIELLVEVGPTA